MPNSTAKAMNSTANGTNSIAKVTNSIAKTFNIQPYVHSFYLKVLNNLFMQHTPHYVRLKLAKLRLPKIAIVN